MAREKKFEMSKGLVVGILVSYAVSMVAAYTLAVLFPATGQITLNIFQTTATLTGSILLGYYGKAGFENYDNHRKLLGFERQQKDEEVEG